MNRPSQKPDPVERLAVSADEAAEMLGISTRTLWSRVSDKTIPTKRIGRRVLFPIEALRELMNVSALESEPQLNE